jgi:hypothetical protein
MHDLTHQAATLIRHHGEHPLRIFKRQSDLAFKGLSAIGSARSVFCALEKSVDIIGAYNDFAHDLFPPVTVTIASHSCWNLSKVAS